MAETVQLQIAALIENWQREKAERNDLADGMATDGNKSYQQGYADALDRCVQSLKLLGDAQGDVPRT
jgi:hypothetical protein